MIQAIRVSDGGYEGAFDRVIKVGQNGVTSIVGYGACPLEEAQYLHVVSDDNCPVLVNTDFVVIIFLGKP